MQDDRDHDVVVFGATGFTGRLVAEYLAEVNREAPIRLALAGRSRDRVGEARDEVAARAPAAADLPIVIADSEDPRTLDAMCRAARVVCTTVGPYAPRGAELVAACVRNRTHYCDLTGEVSFIRRMIDAHDAGARASGSRIVHATGFDSIPSDLGTWMVHDAFAQRGGQVQRVRAIVERIRGGLSGGTAASMLQYLEEMRDPAQAALLTDPYALNPEGERQGPDGPDQFGVARDPVTGSWTA